MVNSQTRGLASHHPYFGPPQIEPYEEGEVDIVDPAIETIISLLSKCRDWEDHGKITLIFDTGYYNIPGIELFVGEIRRSLVWIYLTLSMSGGGSILQTPTKED